MKTRQHINASSDKRGKLMTNTQTHILKHTNQSLAWISDITYQRSFPPYCCLESPKLRMRNTSWRSFVIIVTLTTANAHARIQRDSRRHTRAWCKECYSLCVNGTDVRVFKYIDEKCLCCLLNSKEGERLKAQVVSAYMCMNIRVCMCMSVYEEKENEKERMSERESVYICVWSMIILEREIILENALHICVCVFTSWFHRFLGLVVGMATCEATNCPHSDIAECLEGKRCLVYIDAALCRHTIKSVVMWGMCNKHNTLLLLFTTQSNTHKQIVSNTHRATQKHAFSYKEDQPHSSQVHADDPLYDAVYAHLRPNRPLRPNQSDEAVQADERDHPIPWSA